MAPKRAKRVVKTTKVVQETVQVSIVGSQNQAQAQPKVLEEFDKIREEETTVTTKTVPIEEADENNENDDQETETQEPEFPLEEPKLDNISTPPREEAQPKKQRPKKEEPESKPKRKRGKGKRMREVGEGGEGYKRYVFRVLKQVHPGMGISSKAMTVVNNLMADMFERLAGESAKLSAYNGKQTLSSREIQGAVKLVLPDELGKHAIAEGSKAVSNYIAYGSKK